MLWTDGDSTHLGDVGGESTRCGLVTLDLVQVDRRWDQIDYKDRCPTCERALVDTLGYSI